MLALRHVDRRVRGVEPLGVGAHGPLPGIHGALHVDLDLLAVDLDVDALGGADDVHREPGDARLEGGELLLRGVLGPLVAGPERAVVHEAVQDLARLDELLGLDEELRQLELAGHRGIEAVGLAEETDGLVQVLGAGGVARLDGERRGVRAVLRGGRRVRHGARAEDECQRKKPAPESHESMLPNRPGAVCHDLGFRCAFSFSTRMDWGRGVKVTALPGPGGRGPVRTR